MGQLDFGSESGLYAPYLGNFRGPFRQAREVTRATTQQVNLRLLPALWVLRPSTKAGISVRRFHLPQHITGVTEQGTIVGRYPEARKTENRKSPTQDPQPGTAFPDRWQERVTEDSIEVCVSFLQDLSLCFSAFFFFFWGGGGRVLGASGFRVELTLGLSPFRLT